MNTSNFYACSVRNILPTFILPDIIVLSTVGKHHIRHKTVKYNRIIDINSVKPITNLVTKLSRANFLRSPDYSIFDNFVK